MTVGDRSGPPWLVVVDLQEIFARPDSQWAAPGFAAIVDPVQRLVEAFAPRVVFTRFVAPTAPAGSWVAYYEQWPFALVAPDDPLFDLVPEFRAQERVITRTTFGKWDEELAGLVENGELYLTGVSTDCCVLATALAAADAGMPVRVVRDACAGASEADHDRALAAMTLFAPMIEVVDVGSVLAQLGSCA